MSHLRRTLLCALAIPLAIAAAAMAAAANEQHVLGSDGSLYTAHVAAYGDLFPTGSEYPASARVLLLEVRGADGSVRYHFAPDAESIAPDAVPFLVWEDSSRRLFVIWEGMNRIHSSVNLASFGEEGWSEVVQISGNPFTTKSSPRLAVTREVSYSSDGDGVVESERTILHTVWYEDDYGYVDLLYSPVIFENGAFDLTPPYFEVGSFVRADPSSGRPLSHALLRAPRIVAGSDSQSVLIGFADDATERVVLLGIEALPREISALADELERFLRDEKDPCGGETASLAERARAHLVVIGSRFSPYARAFLADSLRDWLLGSAAQECSQGGAIALRERARAHLVVIGRRALREVIVGGAAASPSHLLTIEGSQQGRHDLALAVAKAIEAPPALGDGLARIHVGASGRNLLVSWRSAADRLSYQEFDGAEWHPAQSLLLSDGFDLEDAYAVLDGRAR